MIGSRINPATLNLLLVLGFLLPGFRRLILLNWDFDKDPEQESVENQSAMDHTLLYNVRGLIRDKVAKVFP